LEDRIIRLGRLAAFCELHAAKPHLDDYERRMFLARARLYRDRQWVEAERLNHTLRSAFPAPRRSPDA